MCMTYRHDYGLNKSQYDPPWIAGMTETERLGLYQTMEQIYNNCVAPLLSEMDDLNEGTKIVLPRNKEHAENMVRVGMFYLNTSKEKK